VRRGDDVLVVHSMRGNELEELLYIQNATTDALLRLERPGTRANRSATTAGLLVFLVLFIAALVIGAGEETLRATLIGSAAIVSALAWRWIHQRMLPTHALPADVDESRRVNQRLLEQKDACLRRLTMVEQSLGAERRAPRAAAQPR